MRVRYTETALLELDEIFAYIAERNPTAAKAVVDRVGWTVGNLANFPEMAQLADEAGTRMIPVGRYPYLIFTPSQRTRL